MEINQKKLANYTTTTLNTMLYYINYNIKIQIKRKTQQKIKNVKAKTH